MFTYCSVAWFHWDSKMNKVIATPDNNCSYIAELIAIELATKIIPTNYNIIIVSDSLSSIQAILNYNQKKKVKGEDIIRRIIKSFNATKRKVILWHSYSHLNNLATINREEKIKKMKKHYGILAESLIQGKIEVDKMITEAKCTPITQNSFMK